MNSRTHCPVGHPYDDANTLRWRGRRICRACRRTRRRLKRRQQAELSHPSGLTAEQLWTHEHIARCTCCGSWEVITEMEKNLRAAGLMPLADECEHLNKPLAQREAS